MDRIRGWFGGKRGVDTEAPTPPPKRKAKEAPKPAERHNTLAACVAKGPDAYTVTLENGTIGGVGEKGGLSDEKLRQEATRSRDAPVPTTKSPVVDASWEQQPRVLNPALLGEGLPVPEGTFAGKKWYENRWLPWQWTIYLQMMYWVQKARGVVPQCCLCLGFISFCTADALVRSVLRCAFGTPFLSNNSVVRVDRRLMEAAADRAWEMRKKFDLRPGVIVNVTTPETAEKGVWVGEGGAGKADCYSSYCTGEAKHTRNHLKSLQSKGLGGMVYTDLIASLQREGGTDEKSARFGNFVKECGASEIFCADDVDAEDVSLALCDDGAAGDDGVVQLVLPVWCSAAGMEVTMRLTTCRGLADTVEEPDAEYCERMCAAVDDMIGGRGSLADRYRRTGLIYNEKDPSSNGELSWILAASYSSKKDMGAYVIALNRARNGSRALVEQTNAALEEVAAVQGTNLEALRADARKREIVVKEVRRVGFGNVPKQAGFGKDLKRGFKRFLGDVTKRLRLTGCMGSANTTAHHPQIFTGTAGTAPMPPAGPPPGYALPPAPAAAPAPAAPQTPGPGGPRRFSTPMGQDAVDNQRGPPRNAPPSAQRSAFQTP